MRVIEVSLEQCRNERGGTAYPRENSSTSGIVRHDMALAINCFVMVSSTPVCPALKSLNCEGNLSREPLLKGAAVAERLACPPPTKAIRAPFRPGHCAISHPAGRCRWSAGLLGDLPPHPTPHSGAAPYPPQKRSSALKTSITTPTVVENRFLSARGRGTGAREPASAVFKFPFLSGSFKISPFHPQNFRFSLGKAAIRPVTKTSRRKALEGFGRLVSRGRGSGWHIGFIGTGYAKSIHGIRDRSRRRPSAILRFSRWSLGSDARRQRQALFTIERCALTPAAGDTDRAAICYPDRKIANEMFKTNEMQEKGKSKMVAPDHPIPTPELRPLSQNLHYISTDIQLQSPFKQSYTRELQAGAMQCQPQCSKSDTDRLVEWYKNPHNTNDHVCFKWVILARHVEGEHPERIDNCYHELEIKFDFSGLELPTPLHEIND
ncbi:hypothetical protein PR048_028563 [Dryococelus australis]|uniref:Uncharacterized protein n=1 Tax=Dryococelus australis TaxID=614101 RepID=A0ABQ9GAY3_9NEOP|nr:hypothetical protein PR048_028563 [Dryococelus australis]